MSALTGDPPGINQFNDHKLVWQNPPSSVLLVHKPNDLSVLEAFKTLTTFLVEVHQLKVYVERDIMQESLILTDTVFNSVRNRLNTYVPFVDDMTGLVDLIICLGGDGTLLHASSMFQSKIPPIMAFNMGSLGFLTPFEFDGFKKFIPKVLQGKSSIILRSRLRCSILKCNGHDSYQKSLTAKTAKHSTPADLSGVCFDEPLRHALNEIVVDRGSAAFICNLDLYINNHYVTSVQGDGLIVSTPTGSTAYSMAAGASMIHPSVPAMLITPINAHSLSFRPIVIPAGVEVKVVLSRNARNTAWVSIDGRSRRELLTEESVCITTSPYPVPYICLKSQVVDWFTGLAKCLHWNVRKIQLSYSENDVSGSSQLSSLNTSPISGRKLVNTTPSPGQSDLNSGGGGGILKVASDTTAARPVKVKMQVHLADSDSDELVTSPESLEFRTSGVKVKKTS